MTAIVDASINSGTETLLNLRFEGPSRSTRNWAAGVGEMWSLLDVLKGRGASTMALVDKAEGTLELEGAFYFARHCGMAGDAKSTVELVRRARRGGFWASWTLERDIAFDTVRGDVDFQAEMAEAKVLEERALCALEEALGYTFAERAGTVSA